MSALGPIAQGLAKGAAGAEEGKQVTTPKGGGQGDSNTQAYFVKLLQSKQF